MRTGKNFIIFFILLLIIGLAGCSSKTDTSVTFRNYASGTIYVNFRGQLLTVDSGESAVVTDLPLGTYSYETTFSIPPGTVSTTTQGEVSGQIQFKTGTKVMVLYSSTYNEGVYTLFATLTSSESLEETTIGP